MLVLKSDSELRIGSLEKRIKDLENRLNPQEIEEESCECLESCEEHQGTEDFQPGLHHDTTEDEPTEIFNELKGEE